MYPKVLISVVTNCETKTLIPHLWYYYTALEKACVTGNFGGIALSVHVMAWYLHVAILISVGEDVPLNVSERSNPGQNSRVQRHVCGLQVRRAINVCGLKCMSKGITAQDQCDVYCTSINTLYKLRSGFQFTKTGENNHLWVTSREEEVFFDLKDGFNVFSKS